MATESIDRKLSPTQRSVLELSASGAATAEVAALLQLSPDEVRRHVADAIKALGARSKLEAVIIALKRGLIQLPVV